MSSFFLLTLFIFNPFRATTGCRAGFVVLLSTPLRSEYSQINNVRRKKLLIFLTAATGRTNELADACW